MSKAQNNIYVIIDGKDTMTELMKAIMHTGKIPNMYMEHQVTDHMIKDASNVYALGNSGIMGDKCTVVNPKDILSPESNLRKCIESMGTPDQRANLIDVVKRWMEEYTNILNNGGDPEAYIPKMDGTSLISASILSSIAGNEIYIIVDVPINDADDLESYVGNHLFKKELCKVITSTDVEDMDPLKLQGKLIINCTETPVHTRYKYTINLVDTIKNSMIKVDVKDETIVSTEYERVVVKEK